MSIIPVDARASAVADLVKMYGLNPELWSPKLIESIGLSDYDCTIGVNEFFEITAPKEFEIALAAIAKLEEQDPVLGIVSRHMIMAHGVWPTGPESRLCRGNHGVVFVRKGILKPGN